MADKNKHAGHYAKYGIISDSVLPDDVRDEVLERFSNDSGRIFNPEYNPKFKAWLEKEEMPVECYIVWCSW
jgi:hypothetical protein